MRPATPASQPGVHCHSADANPVEHEHGADRGYAGAAYRGWDAMTATMSAVEAAWRGFRIFAIKILLSLTTSAIDSQKSSFFGQVDFKK